MEEIRLLLKSRLDRVVYPGPEKTAPSIERMPFDERSNEEVSKGIETGIVFGPSPLQSTFIRLKLLNSPKLCSSHRHPGWHVFTVLKKRTRSAETLPSRRMAIVL